MSYGNYAPFYRPGYFNPMQTPAMPNYSEAPNQYTQPYQPMQNQPMQSIPQMMQETSDLIFVLNETEAVSYPVAPNNRVTLWDKNKDTVYIKSVDAKGIPSMEILDYVKRGVEGEKKPAEHVCECKGKYVPMETYNEFVAQVDVLRAKVDALTLSAKPKAKAKEDTNNAE